MPPVLARNPDCIAIGDDVVIEDNVWFSVVRAFDDITPRLTIEDGVWVGRGSAFGVAGQCTVERGAMIGDFAMIVDTIHPAETEGRLEAVARPMPVRIGAGAVLGTQVVVLPGVTIGAGAYVEHHSVVGKDVAPGDYVSGYPARRRPRPEGAHNPGTDIPAAAV
jgi:acetyltransferase-like isoleucine patch superfamily enzyme